MIAICRSFFDARHNRTLLKRLDTSVRNRFRDQPEVLAEWRTAARVHRTARSTATEMPPGRLISAMPKPALECRFFLITFPLGPPAFPPLQKCR